MSAVLFWSVVFCRVCLMLNCTTVLCLLLLFWEPTQSTPEPAPVREPTESASEPAPFREPTEPAPEPTQWPPALPALPFCSACPTLASCPVGPVLASCSACPALAPLSAYSSRPSSTPRAWPTVPTPDPPPAHPPPIIFFVFSVCGASGIRSLKEGGGGGGRVTVLLVCPGWPPDVFCCWCHVLSCLLSAPPNLLTNHCFSCSTCVSLVTLVCLPI